MNEFGSRYSLKDLVQADDPSNLGLDLGPIVDLSAYRELHPDYNDYAIFAAVLSYLGLSLEETAWGQSLGIEVYSPYVLKPHETLERESLIQEVVQNQRHISIARQLVDFVELLGGKPLPLVFIDDVHHDGMEDGTFTGEFVLGDVASHTQVVEGRTVKTVLEDKYGGMDSKSILIESDFRDAGRGMNQLLADWYPDRIRGITRKRIKGLNGEPDVYLWEKGSDGTDSNDPSCDVLDLMHRMVMAEALGGAIILVPQSYAEQQARVVHLENLVNDVTGYGYGDNIITVLVPESEARTH